MEKRGYQEFAHWYYLPDEIEKIRAKREEDKARKERNARWGFNAGMAGFAVIYGVVLAVINSFGVLSVDTAVGALFALMILVVVLGKIVWD